MRCPQLTAPLPCASPRSGELRAMEPGEGEGPGQRGGQGRQCKLQHLLFFRKQNMGQSSCLLCLPPDPTRSPTGIHIHDRYRVTMRNQSWSYHFPPEPAIAIQCGRSRGNSVLIDFWWRGCPSRLAGVSSVKQRGGAFREEGSLVQARALPDPLSCVRQKCKDRGVRRKD